LLQLISIESTIDETIANALDALQKIEAMLKQWEDLDLFKYMDIDKLFSVCLLNALPWASDIREKLTAEIMEFIRTLEKSNNNNSLDFGSDFVHECVGGESMRILSHASEWMRSVYVPSKALVQIGNKNPKPRFNKQMTDNKYNTNTNTNTNTNRINKFESAAAAGTVGAPTGGAVAGKMFCGEVGRGVNLTFLDPVSSQVHLYTSTELECKKCARTSVSKHAPVCFIGKCNRCNMFGHKATDCMQFVVAAADGVGHQAEESDDLA
jgi:hypothetical protein